MMKLFLVLSLFTATAFAEGDMGTGGKTCPQGQTCITGDMGTGGKTCPPGQTCFTEGDMGTGGKTCPQGQTCLVDGEESPGSIFDLVLDYLSSMF